MAEDIAKEIQQMLEEAWEKLLHDFNIKVPEFASAKPFTEKEAKASHWMYWNEYDLMFHIGRLFYEILSKKKEAKYLNIEIHFEKNINHNNFKDYTFAGSLDKLKEALKMKKGPKVDMIFAYEDKFDPFLLCAEVKYFHGPPFFPKTSIPKIAHDSILKIEHDIKKLKALRDCGIAKRVVFMLFDDYYWYTNKETANDIKHKLDEVNEKGIKVLFGNSEAKLLSFNRK